MVAMATAVAFAGNVGAEVFIGQKLREMVAVLLLSLE